MSKYPDSCFNFRALAKIMKIRKVIIKNPPDLQIEGLKA